MRNIFAVVAALAVAGVSQVALATNFTATETGPSVWTYVLVLDTGSPNFSFNDDDETSSVKITLTGLFGVTDAAGPTGSTHPNNPAGMIDGWVSSVNNGGTEVVFSRTGVGTGNAGGFEISGFTVTAPNSVNGLTNWATLGVVDETVDGPDVSLDDADTAFGPVAGESVPEPASLAVLGVGAVMLLARRRRV